MRLSPDAIHRLTPEERIRSFEEMPNLIRKIGRAGLKVLLVQGVFDIVHAGHTGLVQAARRIDPAETIIVAGLENDAAVRLNKGNRRPVNPLYDRLQVITEFRSISYAFGYEDIPRYDHPEDYLNRWQTLSPHAVVVASWDPHRDLKEWQAGEAGTHLALVNYRHENSTTRMLETVGYEE